VKLKELSLVLCMAAFSIAMVVSLASVAEAWQNADIKARKVGAAVTIDKARFVLKAKNRTDKTEHITCLVKVWNKDGDAIAKGWSSPTETEPKEWRKHKVWYVADDADTTDSWRIIRCRLVELD
jgi:hypothetical protein